MSKNLLVFIVCALIIGAITPETQAIQSASSFNQLSPHPNSHEWAIAYGGVRNQLAFSIEQTSDGGYIVAGDTNSNCPSCLSFDVWVLKLNSTGGLVWQHTYGGKGNEYANSIEQTSDGGYVFAGFSSSFCGGAGAWVVKLNSTGGVIWQSAYCARGTTANSIRQTTDGGYIVAGSLTVNNIPNTWVLKIDSEGLIEWSKTYVSGFLSSIQKTNDGGYVVAGNTANETSMRVSTRSAWIAKLDSDGRIQWQKSYGGAGTDAGVSDFSSVASVSDGNFVLAGSVASSFAQGAGGWILKVNGTNGKIIWQRAYGQSGSQISSIEQTTSGAFIVAGTISGKLWLLKLGANGGIVWQVTYGGSKSDSGLAVEQTTDGGYVVAGATTSFDPAGHGFQDVWVLKLPGNGLISNCSAGGTTSVTPVATSAHFIRSFPKSGTLPPTGKTTRANVGALVTTVSTTCSG